MNTPPDPANPEDSATLLQRSAVLRETGDLAGAAALYRTLATRHPGEPGLWAMLGDALRVSGNPEGGADALGKAVALAPDDTAIAIEYALALLDIGQSQAALTALAGREVDDSPRGLSARADAYRLLGQPGAAIAPYRRLCTLQPGNVEAHISLGVCLQETEDLEGAIACYEKAIAAAPESAAALTNLGLAHSAAGDVTAARDALQEAVALEPDDPDTQCALGAVLQKIGQSDRAVSCFESAISVTPEHARAWSNLGNARQDQLRLKDALAAHDRAVALAPDDAEIHWNQAMSLLLSGELAAGFAAYEWRFRTKNHAPPTHNSPRWAGGAPRGQRILLLAEQGFGDAIQFVRYAAILRARGADIVLQCHPKLVTLFETLSGSPKVIATGEAPPPVDAHLPLMSLPHLLGTTPDSVPADIPYLHAAQDARRPPPPDGRRRIGLCWTGNPDHPDNMHRSLPFASLAPLLVHRDIDWRSLQFGPAAGDAHGFLPDNPAWTACLEGFGNTAAALESCDLVITVDTSTAHLAGALGRPVWLLLKYAPDWRWMIGRDDSPWYPTARLFRQTRPGDWNDVIDRVDAALTVWTEN